MADDPGVTGEAIYGGLLSASMLGLLVAQRIVQKQAALEMIDTLLLTLERYRNIGSSMPPEAIDHARSRAEALLAQIRAL